MAIKMRAWSAGIGGLLVCGLAWYFWSMKNEGASGSRGSAAGRTPSAGGAAARSETSLGRPTLISGPCSKKACPLATATGFPGLSGDSSVLVITFSTASLGPQDLWLKVFDVESGRETAKLLVYGSEEGPSAFEKVASRVKTLAQLLAAGAYRSMLAFEQTGLVSGFNAEAKRITVKECASDNFFDPVCDGTPIFLNLAFDPRAIAQRVCDRVCSPLGAEPFVSGAVDRKKQVMVLTPTLNTADTCEVDAPVLVRKF